MSSTTPSNTVLQSSPTSLTGGTRRVLRRLDLRFDAIAQPALQIALRGAWWATIAVWLLAATVLALLVWNVIAWTLFLVPTLIVRAFGRSKRRARLAQAQHLELLEALRKDA